MNEYAGARGRITTDDLRSLGPQWSLQPKHDGAYAMLLCGDSGEVVRVLSRTGRPYEQAIHRMQGQVVGAPNSILIGEGTWHTERGVEEAQTLGYTKVYIFDALMVAGQSLTGLSYEARREITYRQYAKLQGETDGKTWLTDARGRAHHRGNGRFTIRRPKDWRRVAMVEQRRVDSFDELWDQVLSGEIEGVVAVSQRAKLGARGSKFKCKPIEHLDCIVISASDRRALVRSFGVDFTVGCSGHPLQLGDVVEVCHEGFYKSGLPRFPRIVRTRPDLALDGGKEVP